MTEATTERTKIKADIKVKGPWEASPKSGLDWSLAMQKLSAIVKARATLTMGSEKAELMFELTDGLPDQLRAEHTTKEQAHEIVQSTVEAMKDVLRDSPRKPDMILFVGHPNHDERVAGRGCGIESATVVLAQEAMVGTFVNSQFFSIIDMVLPSFKDRLKFAWKVLTHRGEIEEPEIMTMTVEDQRQAK